MKYLYWLACITLLGACGSAGTGTTVTASTGNNVTIYGSVVAGALNGTVSVRNHAGNQYTATVLHGQFRISLPVSWLAATTYFSAWGSYSDEVSGQTVTVSSAAPLRMQAAANTLGAQGGYVAITTETTVVADMINSGLSQARAEQNYQQTFGHLPQAGAHVFDPYATSAATAAQLILADPYAGDAAFYAGSFSQFASDMGISNPADLALLPSLLAADLADGRLDGLDAAAQPVVVPSGNINLQVLHAHIPLPDRFLLAMTHFVGSSANTAALPAPATGLPPVHGDAPGTVRDITLANGRRIRCQLDASYATPFTAPFANVRSRHILTLTDLGSNLPLDIYSLRSPLSSLRITPLMHAMSGDQYSAPMSVIDISQHTQGRYMVDVFYWTPSVRSNGSAMGLWELNVQMTDNSTAQALPVQLRFYPEVTTAINNDVLQLAVSNPADQWLRPDGVIAAREYHLWLQDITPSLTTGYDVTVFLSTRDTSTATAFPALTSGLILHDASGIPFPVSTVSLGVWQHTVCQPLSPVAGHPGSYLRRNIFGPAIGVPARLSFCLTVNGNAMKTTTGSDPALIVTL